MENYIEITENKSKINVNDMVNVCKRINNNKRDYLFVNSFQGKHIPKSPGKIIDIFEELTIEIGKNIDKNERVLVIGFAETATAIGKYVASKLDNCVYVLQTTREEDASLDKIISFEEEHSHAVGQWIYSKNKLPEYDRVLFVEDEITTGNTIINFIDKFREINPQAKYSVASILNWQNEKDTELYREMEIETYYLIRGKLKDNIEPMEIVCDDYLKKGKVGGAIKTNIKYNFENRDLAGNYPNSTIGSYVNKLGKFIEKTILNEGSVLVIGTEEFMYIPLIVAEDIENRGYSVKFHATTRSPICVNDKEKGYAITNGIKTESAYGERETFLYNVGEYDNVIVITDTHVSIGFEESIVGAFGGTIDIIEMTEGGYDIW